MTNQFFIFFIKKILYLKELIADAVLCAVGTILVQSHQDFTTWGKILDVTRSGSRILRTVLLCGLRGFLASWSAQFSSHGLSRFSVFCLFLYPELFLDRRYRSIISYAIANYLCYIITFSLRTSSHYVTLDLYLYL